MNSFEGFGGFEAGSADVGEEETGEINPLESRLDARSIILGEMSKFMDHKMDDDKPEENTAEENGIEEIKEVEAEENKNETEEPETSFAGDIEYLRWIKDVSKYMLEYGNDPEEMQEFWMEFEDNFKASGEEGRIYAAKIKYEILTQVAAQNLVKNFGEDLAEDGWNIEVEIKPSAPEEDLDSGINFWAQMRVNGEEKIIPCRAIYVEVNPGASRKDAERSKAMVKFVGENFLSFERPGDGKYNNSGDRQSSRIIGDLEKYWKEEVAEFYKSNEGKGIFITLPVNMESALPASEKSRSPRAILPTGKVNDSLYKGFMKNTRPGRERFVQSLS